MLLTDCAATMRIHVTDCLEKITIRTQHPPENPRYAKKLTLSFQVPATSANSSVYGRHLVKEKACAIHCVPKICISTDTVYPHSDADGPKKRDSTGCANKSYVVAF